jgi:Na+/H+-dicarboxylate symporter
MVKKTSDESKKRPSFTTLIVLGLVLGVIWGLFFGEYASWIKWIGDAYVGLLQMAVLPYVAFSLIANVGRLSVSDGIRLVRIGVTLILLLWCIGFLALLIMTLAFPEWESGSFFSSRFTEEPPPHNWLDLFIPANPFRSFTENWIPAVVVFSIGTGIALMAIPNKATFLDPLDVVVTALGKLNKLVVKLTPLGMFAIVAYTTGTTDLAQFNLIQGYLLTYGASAVILAFFVLPSLIAAVTPLKFAEVLKASRDPLIAAFVIGNTFVVLPMIIEAVKRLMEDHQVASGQQLHQPEYLVSLAYPFPDIGRIVGLIFIPFAAWFYGTSIDPDSYPALLGVGVLGSFAKPVITVPLLLNIAELPGDIFNLFLASGVIAARFGDLMKSMHLMTFTILASCLALRVVKINWQKLIFTAAGSFLLLLIAAMSIRAYLGANFKDQYSKEQLVTERELIFPLLRPLAKINPQMAEDKPNPDPIRPGKTRVERIVDRGFVRIGIDPKKIPFSYKNADGKPVGFDIEMAYFLADDLGVNIEFVPIDQPNLQQQLRDDHFDIAMSAQEGTVEQAAQLPAIDPYMDVTLAIVVPDHEKSKFRTVDDIFKIPDLKLGVIKGSFFAERAPKVLPGNIQVVELESAEEFFEGRHTDLSGLVISAEAGSAWTFLKPEYTVANPVKGRVRVPLYYLTAADDEFESFLQNWLTLKKSDGTYDELYDYWILGLNKQNKKPRWCILRDVLGWVE